MSFPFDSAARLVSQFRELNEPVTSLPSIVPVAMLADYTRRSSSEPIECRALCGWVEVAVIGRTPYFQITAPTRPVVLESLRLKQDYTDGSMALTLAVSPIIPPAPGLAMLPMGGVGPTAWIQSATWPGALGGTTIIPLEQGTSEFPADGGLRLLIPQGRTLTVTSGLTNNRWEVALILREIVT